MSRLTMVNSPRTPPLSLPPYFCLKYLPPPPPHGLGMYPLVSPPLPFPLLSARVKAANHKPTTAAPQPTPAPYLDVTRTVQ